MELSHPQAVIRLKDITAELERLGEKADLTPEDEQVFDELTREFAEVDNHRRHLERTAALERIRSAARVSERAPAASSLRLAPGTSGSADDYDLDPVLNPDSVQDCRFRNPWDLTEVRTFSRGPGEVAQELRARSLSAIEKMPGATDGVRQAATTIIERFDDTDSRIARMCLATSSPEYMRAWSKLASGRPHLLTEEEQTAVNRAMSLTDSQGGYLVPFQLDPTVIITSDGSLNQIRRAARSVVATGDVWNGVSAGEVSWSWDGEATEVSDDAPTFAQPSITVHKAAGFVPISVEALEDEANVTAEVARLLAMGRDSLEAEAFISGSGTGRPTGLVTALNASAVTGVVVNSATAATFALEDVYALDDALPARYRANASWLGNRQTYNDVRQFDTSGGAGLWVRLGGDVPSELLQRPAYESEDMDAGATTGNDTLIYGDFSNYVIADRIGMSIEFVPHLFGTGSNRPTGQRGWYAYYRVGADSVNDGAFRMLNIS